MYAPSTVPSSSIMQESYVPTYDGNVETYQNIPDSLTTLTQQQAQFYQQQQQATQLHPHPMYTSSIPTQRPYSPGSIEVENLLRAPNSPPIVGKEDIRNRDVLIPEYRKSSTSTSGFTTSPTGSHAYNIPASSSSSPSSSSFSPSSSLSPDHLHLLSSETGELLQKFHSSRTNSLRPIIYQPNGSFQALKESGKLSLDEHDLNKNLNENKKMKNPLANTSYHLPGYTGFVRAKQHIIGRTYGELSRIAIDKNDKNEYNNLAIYSDLPAPPQYNLDIKQEKLNDTFITHTFGEKKYMVPGYTGFVPGVRNTYAKCYGTATEEEMKKNTLRYPQLSAPLEYSQKLQSSSSSSATTSLDPNATNFNNTVSIIADHTTEEKNGFANTALHHPKYNLNSAPLPGGAKTLESPDMYIPNHIKYLKFFPM